MEGLGSLRFGFYQVRFYQIRTLSNMILSGLTLSVSIIISRLTNRLDSVAKRSCCSRHVLLAARLDGLQKAVSIMFCFRPVISYYASHHAVLSSCCVLFCCAVKPRKVCRFLFRVDMRSIRPPRRWNASSAQRRSGATHTIIFTILSISARRQSELYYSSAPSNITLYHGFQLFATK